MSFAIEDITVVFEGLTRDLSQAHFKVGVQDKFTMRLTRGGRVLMGWRVHTDEVYDSMNRLLAEHFGKTGPR